MGENGRVKKKDKKQDKSVPGWELAAQEAERQILAHRRSIVQLQSSVRIFKGKISSGEPWPGVQELDRKERASG